MNLFLLRYREDSPKWDPWYDKNFSVVVRAASEADARRLAASSAEDEGAEAWLSEEHSTCTKLYKNGEEGIIIVDHHAA